MNDPISLGEALPQEIERVQEIIAEYDAVPGGFLAAADMRNDIKKAHKAMIEGDVLEMVTIYAELKQWRL